MSYDIELTDPVTGETLELDAQHHMRGGTYAVGGTTRAHLNVTYNYYPQFHRVFDVLTEPMLTVVRAQHIAGLPSNKGGPRDAPSQHRAPVR